MRPLTSRALLGMIWHMNPIRMPHAFCLIQVILFSLGSFALTGLSASFSVANALAVFQPLSFNSGNAILAWHPRYIPLVVVFPFVASGIHIGLLIFTNAVQPSLSDDLHCDATHPLWMRLVGYAGVPLVVSIPFLFLSCLTAFHLYRKSRVGAIETCHTDQDNYIATSTPAPLYEVEEDKGRNRQYRFTAFLPSNTNKFCGTEIYPPQDYILPECTSQHSLPPLDPLTGKAYSPSLEDANGTPLTTMIHGLPSTSRHQSHDKSPHPRNLSPANRANIRKISTESEVSCTMPVFAPSIIPAQQTPTTQVVGPVDPLVGLAITTDESLRTSKTEISSDVGEAHSTRYAITADELKTVSPISNKRTLPVHANFGNGDPPRPEGVAISDTPRSLDSREVEPEISMDQDPSVHTGFSVQYLPRPADNSTLSFPSESTSPGLHHHPSIVSSATLYSTPHSHSERDCYDSPPFTPGSGSTYQAPTTTKDTSISAVLNLGFHNCPTVIEEGRHHSDQKCGLDDDWDDDGYGFDDGPVRTVKSRDPRERLGVYNPTPATATLDMLEERRPKPQRTTHYGSSRRLRAAIWRMVLFQIAFFCVQLLASLSSIIDVIQHKITPFGTQHVALLLAAWGPLFIFGRVPKSVRRLWIQI
ncbi:hypothetical protein K439DRAFT_1613032 [Ramaria rubella]|nr:hypothetical protein K439DRAFT_1613032 [Ramaria rubella]